MDNDPQNIQARTALLDGCAKIEAERRKPLGGIFYIAESEDDFLLCSLSYEPKDVKLKVAAFDALVPGSEDEPYRIVKVRIEEVMG